MCLGHYVSRANPVGLTGPPMRAGVALARRLGQLGEDRIGSS